MLTNSIKPISGKDWTTAKLSTLIKNPVYVKADNEIYHYYFSHSVRIVNEVQEFDSIHGAMLYGKTTHNQKLSDWFDMKLVLMEHEGIILSDIWLKCQQKIEKNKQIGNSLSNRTSWKTCLCKMLSHDDYKKSIKK